jgi:hypothetical protein
MSFEAQVIKILIASPSDVVNERKAIPEVLHAWNAANAEDRRGVALPVMWETHAAPMMGDRPQAIINKQFVETCDVLIGAFWTRIGTHTGVAESGTVEEIEEFIRAGKPVMLYFSTAPVAPDSIDPTQYQQLVEFKRRCMTGGYVESYESIAELKEKLLRQLAVVLSELCEKEMSDEEAESIATTAILSQLREDVERIAAEWTAEKDAEPNDIDGGKAILNRLSQLILDHLRVFKNGGGDRANRLVKGVVRHSKELQAHEVYADGGDSYAEFWRNGDQVVEHSLVACQELAQSSGRAGNKPDIRVTLTRGQIVPLGFPPEDVVTVRAENHDSRPVYLGGGVSYERDDTDKFSWVARDAVGQWLTKKILAPGDAYTVTIPMVALEDCQSHIVRFFITDEIGNTYATGEPETRMVLKV